MFFNQPLDPPNLGRPETTAALKANRSGQTFSTWPFRKSGGSMTQSGYAPIHQRENRSHEDELVPLPLVLLGIVLKPFAYKRAEA